MVLTLIWGNYLLCLLSRTISSKDVPCVWVKSEAVWHRGSVFPPKLTAELLFTRLSNTLGSEIMFLKMKLWITSPLSDQLTVSQQLSLAFRRELNVLESIKSSIRKCTQLSQIHLLIKTGSSISTEPEIRIFSVLLTESTLQTPLQAMQVQAYVWDSFCSAMLF